MGFLSALIHFILVVHYGYGIHVYLFGLHPPEEFLKHRVAFGGPFKYLTFWDMLLQFAYFALAFINDVFGSNTPIYEKRKPLQRLRDFVFSTVVFAGGVFVTVSFWGLYLFDRNLIFPPIFDSWFPVWLNHNVHTTPLVGVLIELYLNPHSFPRRRTGFSAVALFYLTYLVWVCYIAYASGHWVYPILAYLPVGGRVAFILLMSVLASSFYFLGETINNKVWGTQIKAHKMD
ncbi:androgen-induced gene 1 protein-like [Palaemon carinicauda]|uniref:androgen-induced gene 1 protein-like n=1 Tax=Palaemon carinicauda TaxID=392227 RepID=UPI0035B5D757